MKKRRLGYIILAILGIVSVFGFAITDPIEQNENYHNFSDTLIIFGVPNFWNVISNLPFLIVGILGIYRLRTIQKFNLQFFVFFTGISLVAIGSGYYHYAPNSQALVWDRLPMTIAFTALISIVISEFIDSQKGKILLFPLVILGVFSIFYWIEFNDLRLYALVQFYPMLAMPVVLILFKSDDNLPNGYWLLLIAYIVAKVFEIYDGKIYDEINFLSGHSLKHIIASVGVYLLINSRFKKQLEQRKL